MPVARKERAIFYDADACAIEIAYGCGADGVTLLCGSSGGVLRGVVCMVSITSGIFPQRWEADVADVTDFAG